MVLDGASVERHRDRIRREFSRVGNSRSLSPRVGTPAANEVLRSTAD
jgi:hypothetical protein